MSLKTLPLLFINLGGEMMYILDQRLRAQNIPQDKARKVIYDIVGTMYNKRFMEELFKPQELYSKKAMRTVFDRLAHASIMRLNSASMDKLYDLMTMAFKYQVSLCLRPSDILLVTLNHLDAIAEFVQENSPVNTQVENVYRLLIQHYGDLTPGEFMLIRQTLLNFFQDMHIRVSIFLKDKVQNSNGRFVLPAGGLVPWATEVPGTIRTFNERGQPANQTQFSMGGQYKTQAQEGSFSPNGNRVTKLGTNMYSIARTVEAMTSGPTKQSTASADMDTSSPNPLAKAQLDLLSHLIGGEKKKGRSEFRLNLFNTDEEEIQAEAMRQSQGPSGQFLNIDASKGNSQKKQNSELSRIMGEMNVAGGSADDEEDLLDLMDSAK